MKRTLSPFPDTLKGIPVVKAIVPGNDAERKKRVLVFRDLIAAMAKEGKQ
jgi:hypothetical protein